MSVRKPFVLALQGTSLTTGRLSADWVARLTADLPQQPEAIGPIRVYNLGKGQQTSDWGLTNAALLSTLKPTHIGTEGFAINDCFNTGSGPQVTRAAHIVNIQGMVADWRAKIPGVDITIKTMSPVSTFIAAGRAALADYYADEIATAAALSTRAVDHYANWVKPLPQASTYIDSTTGLGDGLHPIWAGAVDTYFYPAELAFWRARMAEHWA